MFNVETRGERNNSPSNNSGGGNSSSGGRPSGGGSSYSGGRPSFGGRPSGGGGGGGFRRFSRPSRGGRPGGFRSGKSTRIQGTSISVEQLIKKVDTESKAGQIKFEIKHKFDDFLIDARLKLNIAKKGYVSPTPIQDQSIPPLLEGRDVIGLANTGTGKTAAFLIPLINKMLLDRTQKAIILAPTRELAVQIQDELRGFTQGMNLASILVIGGANIREQGRKMKMPFNFIIGTPGRVIDLYERKWLHLDRFQNVVLDEADRMVDMGFIDDMKLVFSKLPKSKQTMFFTATMERQIEGLVQQFLNSPVMISVKQRETAANVEQDVVRVGGAHKFDVLADLLGKPEFEKVLIFGRTKHGVEKIAKLLRHDGFKVDSIHGNKSQSQRTRALSDFKRGILNILVATDIAARGLDIVNVSHVINFDLPASYEDYVHRIGRTGRADKKGMALSLI